MSSGDRADTSGQSDRGWRRSCVPAVQAPQHPFRGSREWVSEFSHPCSPDVEHLRGEIGGDDLSRRANPAGSGNSRLAYACRHVQHPLAFSNIGQFYHALTDRMESRFNLLPPVLPAGGGSIPVPALSSLVLYRIEWLCAHDIISFSKKVSRVTRQTSEIHAHREGSVYDQVGAGCKGRGRACQEHCRLRNFLRRGHASRRVAPHDLLEQVGHVLLDVVPYAPFEVDVARRDSVRTDTPGRFLPRDALGEVDERRLQRAIGGCHMDLSRK